MRQAPPSLEALNEALSRAWPNHPRVAAVAPWATAAHLDHVAVPARCDPPTPNSEALYAASAASGRGGPVGAGYNNYLLVDARDAAEYRVFGLRYAADGVGKTLTEPVITFALAGSSGSDAGPSDGPGAI